MTKSATCKKHFPLTTVEFLCVCARLLVQIYLTSLWIDAILNHCIENLARTTDAKRQFEGFFLHCPKHEVLVLQDFWGLQSIPWYFRVPLHFYLECASKSRCLPRCCLCHPDRWLFHPLFRLQAWSWLAPMTELPIVHWERLTHAGIKPFPTQVGTCPPCLSLLASAKKERQERIGSSSFRLWEPSVCLHFMLKRWFQLYL